MTVFCLGSINADFIYEVGHIPQQGETVLAHGLFRTLGGKGANQSVAAARAGADVRHIGMVGPDGAWCVQALAGFGVDVRHVGEAGPPTAHANITVDPSGENAITVFAGANHAQSPARVEAALSEAGPGDWLMLQNETTLQAEAAQLARARGMQVAYSAAPFDEVAVRAVLPHVTLLIMNAVEATQLAAVPGETGAVRRVITNGPEGAEWRDGDLRIAVTAPQVRAVDTTGAGDTFAGYLVAGLSGGLAPRAAMLRAVRAAALQVTKPGTAEAIPTLDDVLSFSG